MAEKGKYCKRESGPGGTFKGGGSEAAVRDR